MDFLTHNWLLILLALTSGGMLLWPMVAGGAGGTGKVSANEAVRLINREKAVLIDVCEPAEFAAGHAAGARNVPLGQLDGAKGLPGNKTLPIVVVCPSGARATRGAAMLRKQGYEKVVALAGGTNAWRDASLPVEKTA
jgi:rhodanese-related sulfurtransferase